MLTFPGLQRVVQTQRLIRWRLLAQKIQRCSDGLTGLSNEELRKKSLSLRYQALSGQSLNSLLVDAFALVREAAGRTLGMRHYPVQILGGVAIHFGAVAIMQTGEGKTLTATLPMYLAALAGQGAHLATANDYLAQRDADLMRDVYDLLGMKVGVVVAESSPEMRKQGYAADITYSTAKEIGFDFLRDRLAKRNLENVPGAQWAGMATHYSGAVETAIVQRPFYFALVDEADSILIDEARTPLIVSTSPSPQENPRADLYRWACEHAKQFQPEHDYEHEVHRRRVHLTATGRRQTRVLPKPRSLAQIATTDIYEFVERAIAVDLHYVKERQYIVVDKEVQIVDEFTGRVAEGRKWRGGLHQAIEAREGLKISQETGEAARITIQDLFLQYNRIGGMTGTVARSGPELQKIYGLLPSEIPTNRPPRRKKLPDRVFATAAQKWEAIAEEVQQVHQTGRAVLIGTRSIDLSEHLSQRLTARGLKHHVLNATHIATESEIVAQAGQVGQITVATNMAGRGTDIKLSSEALAAGGLHVICSELHESARIDRQLVGRCGRQGDPGSFRHYHSWEDDILTSGFGEKAKRRMDRGQKIQQAGAANVRLFSQAQRKVEQQNFKARKQLLYHENQRQQLQREMGQDPYLDTIE